MVISVLSHYWLTANKIDRCARFPNPCLDAKGQFGQDFLLISKVISRETCRRMPMPPFSP